MATYRAAELKDTVSLMCSDDYKERFKAEYAQVAVRYEKLKAMLDKWDIGCLLPLKNRLSSHLHK